MNYNSTIDGNKSVFLKVVDNLKKANDIDCCGEDILSEVEKESLDYNQLSALFAISVNRCINLGVAEVDNNIQDEKCPEKTLEIGKRTIDAQNKIIAKIELELSGREDTGEFIEYLKGILNSIVNSFTHNNGYWEREEKIYDAMHELAKRELTKKYEIEIPYLYILSWAAPSFFGAKQGKGGLEYGERNTLACLSRLGKTMRSIFVGETVSYRDDGPITIFIKEEESYLHHVDFRGLLPYLEVVERIDESEQYEYYRSHKDKIISKKILLRIPMIPFELPSNPTEGFKSFLEWAEERSKAERLNEELKKINGELLATQEELKKTIRDKNALVDHHAHNWKHIVYPKTVKEVAETLYVEGNVEYANRLFKAYNSEKILQHDLQLLKLSHASSPSEMQKAFRNDVLLSDARSGIGIKKIIEDSLDIVLFRIIMEGVDTRYILDDLKQNISAFNDMESLRKSYADSFISKKTQYDSVLDWFNDNVYRLQLDIDSCWEDVKVKADGIAYTQLVEIFINLIHNSINYGIKSKEGFLSMELGHEEVSGQSYCTLSVENPADYDSAFSEGSNQGLETIRDTLEKLNGSDSSNDKDRLSLEAGSKDNIHFKTKLYFKEKIVIKRREKKQ